MKIVVLDGYCENPGDLSWAPLEAFGEVTVYDRTPDVAEEIIKRIGDADILVGNKNTITGEIMDACKNLKYIAVQATGYNVIDVAAAKERGIPVSNVPTYGTAAVAQHTIALLLEITNGVGHHSNAVHEGRWQTSPDWCFWDHPLIELDGKTMGIVGFGKIGQQTGRLAKALGMKVLAAGGDMDAIKSYLDKLETDLNTVDTVVKTGNAMADAILNSKISLAKAKGIAVHCDAHIPVRLKMSELDLCCIIGNLFDNAIEANLPLPEDRRQIRVYMDMKGTQLYISFTNFTSAKKMEKVGELFRSTKGDGHGFGLVRIDNIIERLDGYLSRNSEDGAFTTEILIPRV